ncbi:2100_t:CDS:2, partial [Dentiscutata heterogama]
DTPMQLDTNSQLKIETNPQIPALQDLLSTGDQTELTNPYLPDPRAHTEAMEVKRMFENPQNSDLAWDNPWVPILNTDHELALQTDWIKISTDRKSQSKPPLPSTLQEVLSYTKSIQMPEDIHIPAKEQS